MNVEDICNKFYLTKKLSFEEFKFLYCLEDFSSLNAFARKLALKNFSNKIYIRGLIEISTVCKNNCYYCGLRSDNKNTQRIRLKKEDILKRAEAGYKMGIRTLVMQGGEDPFYTKHYMVDIIKTLKNIYPDIAITLSLGERSFEDFKAFKEAGADRYLLRHETYDRGHYQALHPREMSFDNRIECLYNLKSLGFQTGCGMMIGSPYQKIENVYKDLELILKLKPQMVGLGPFIAQKDSPFNNYENGKLSYVLKILSIVRIADEKVLLPATTALGTIHKMGRELGILAGANVLMPNIGSEKLRQSYKLYDNKIGTKLENEDDFFSLSSKVGAIGYELSMSRGDYWQERLKSDLERRNYV